MNNDNSPHHIFSHFVSQYLINLTLSDPSTPSLSFEDTQHPLSKFYKRFFTILLTKNQERIFAFSGKVPRSELGKLEPLKL